MVQRIIELAAGQGKKFPNPRRELRLQVKRASRLFLGLFGRFAGIWSSRRITSGGITSPRQITSPR
jgi:hypothetical protein